MRRLRISGFEAAFQAGRGILLEVSGIVFFSWLWG